VFPLAGFFGGVQRHFLLCYTWQEDSQRRESIPLQVQVGDRIRIDPFPDEAEVFEIRQGSTGVTLGVIFHPSQRAERFVFTPEEFTRRVHRLPSLWEAFPEKALRLREPCLLFIDALRMRLAYAFDPYYAVSVTQVDLLPHQVDAVYRHILPLSRIRFLLADDPGLGKTDGLAHCSRNSKPGRLSNCLVEAFSPSLSFGTVWKEGN